MSLPFSAVLTILADTLIVWTEPTTSIDMALSFQEPDGCSMIWLVNITLELFVPRLIFDQRKFINNVQLQLQAISAPGISQSHIDCVTANIVIRRCLVRRYLGGPFQRFNLPTYARPWQSS